MRLVPIIGLEIHLQLKTKTKMFCGCAAHDTAVSPNTHVCPVCTGQPGALPVPNEEAVKMGVLMGLALNCTIATHSKFDRKNYFYPDLPKAYQISQFDLPIAEHGHLDLEIPNGERETVRASIVRAHLEEDAGKNFHGEEGRTYVDFNRCGTPLIEIVTGPDFHSPQEAKVFMQELRLIARTLGIADADMEKGQMRCDANISLREVDKNGDPVGARLNPKTEVKNINSFRFVERAIAYEIKRQTELWEAGNAPQEETTRGWNEKTQKTDAQRSKEATNDYRYFPEPDIPAMDLTDIAEEMRRKVPELPQAKRRRFVDEYGFRMEDARHICEDPVLADFTENTYSELLAWLQSLPDQDEKALAKEQKKLSKLLSGWLLSKLKGLMAERSINIRTIKITPENFAEFITLIATKKLNSATGMKVLAEMLESGADPSHVMEDKALGSMDDEEELAEVVSRVLEQNPGEVERYKNGEKQLIKLFIGLVMKATEGNADPGLTKNILLVKLES